MESNWSVVWGNPSSAHSLGREARAAIQNARQSVAKLIGAESDEIVFTSGATESNNTAIFSGSAGNSEGRIVTTAVEHSSVRSPCAWLRRKGVEVVEANVDRDGAIDLDEFAKLLPGAALASVMWVNNETGVIFPIEAIAALCAENNVPLHVDAVQAAGKIPICVNAGTRIDYLSLSGHKNRGPQRCWCALREIRDTAPTDVFRRRSNARRPGTENLISIIGLGIAAREAALRLPSFNGKIAALRDNFERQLTEKIPGCQVNGARAARVANTSNIAFPVEDGESLLMLLDQKGVLASSGSACHAASPDPSHVLLAMGLERIRAKSSVRFSLGYDTTAEELHETVEIVVQSVGRLTGIAA